MLSVGGLFSPDKKRCWEIIYYGVWIVNWSITHYKLIKMLYVWLSLSLHTNKWGKNKTTCAHSLIFLEYMYCFMIIFALPPIIFLRLLITKEFGKMIDEVGIVNWIKNSQLKKYEEMWWEGDAVFIISLKRFLSNKKWYWGATVERSNWHENMRFQFRFQYFMTIELL